MLGTNDSSHWLSFCLNNQSDETQNFVLATSPAIMAEIDFYPLKKGLKSFQTGNARPMKTRDIHSPEFHFNITLNAGETQYFYMRVSSRANPYISANLWHEPFYIVAKDKAEGLDGIFVGILFGLILYTLLLYISVRQSSSLLYILWSGSTLLLFASIDGRVLQYLVPNSPSVSYLSVVVFYPLSIILSALFAREFIKLKDYVLLNKIGTFIVVCFVIVLLITYQYALSSYFRVNGAFGFIVVLYFGLLAPIYAVVTNQSVQARYLLFAQLPLIVCILDRTLFTMELTSRFYVPYSAKVGLVAEKILLAYYIGVTIYREKAEAQRLAVEQLQISNDLKSNYNEQLEAEIKSNTAEIVSMNESLEAQAKKLLEADDVKSQFFANVSHEFRTPITLIQGRLTQLLEQRDNFDPSIIINAIDHSKALQNLVDQLLTLSKFDADSLALQTQRMNVSDTVKLLSSQFSSAAESKGVSLHFESSAPDAYAYIDAEKLKVMINNLLSNAIKFTQKNDAITVKVSTTITNDTDPLDPSRDEYVEIKVIDTGHGIPSDELEFIFDRFYQSRNSATVGSGLGTGIGLALVKEFALMHAGDVLVRSVAADSNREQNCASGSEFTIRLPLGRAHLHAHEIIESHASPVALQTVDIPKDLLSTSLESAPELTQANQTERKTILIVDDNDDMRHYLRSLLEPEYHVEEAEDGERAEQCVRRSQPDLIVTDLMMPKRDGLEFVKSLKQDSSFANIPVIMLTARAGLDDRLKGLMAAVDDYMAKPFDARELITRIENLLKKQAQFNAFYQSRMALSVEEQNAGELQDSLIAQLRRIVEKHLGDSKFGVAELAKEMHVSKATLHRRLADESCFTPSEFIRQCRLKAARQLSAQGRVKSISELANAVGFNQVGYFSRLYQKTFNCPPLSEG